MNQISYSFTHIRQNDQPLSLIAPLNQNIYDVLNICTEETIIELIKAQKIDLFHDVICFNGLEMKLIHVAASQGWVKVCKFLLDAGESVNVEARSLFFTGTFHTPLFQAILNFKFHLAEMLIEHGANIYQSIPEELNQLVASHFIQGPTLGVQAHENKKINLNLAEYIFYIYIHNDFNENSISIGNFLMNHASSICLKKLPPLIINSMKIAAAQATKMNTTLQPAEKEKELNEFDRIFLNFSWGDLLISNYKKFPENYSAHIDLLYKSAFPISKENLSIHSKILDLQTFNKILPLLSEDINKDSTNGNSLLDISLKLKLEKISLSILSKAPNVKVIINSEEFDGLNCYDIALIMEKGKISTVSNKILEIGEGFGEVLKLQKLVQLRFDFRVATKIDNRLIEFDGYKSEITFPEVFESLSAFIQINSHLMHPEVISFIHNTYWSSIHFTTGIEANESLNQGHSIVLISGWQGHAVTVYIDKKKKHFCVMNRGDRNSGDESGITLYEMDAKIEIKEIIELLCAKSPATKQFFYDIQNNPFFTKKLVLKHKDQKTGSCTWKSPKTAGRTVFLAAYLALGLEMNDAIELSGIMYKRWAIDFDKVHGLAKYLNHPYHSRPQLQNEAEGIMRERMVQECLLHSPKSLKVMLIQNLLPFLDPLQKALFLQDTTAALEIIQSDTYNPIVSSHSYSPFHLAARFGIKEIVEALLQKNLTSVNEMINTVKPSPVHLALENNHSEIAKMLIPFINEIDYCDSKTKTLLSLACEKFIPDVAEQLLKHHAKPNFVDKSGKLPIEYLCLTPLKDSHLSTARKVIFDLLFPKVDLFHIDKDGFTLLHYSILTEDPEIFKAVIQGMQENKCSLINNKTNTGNTALTLALKKEFKIAIKELINLEAGLNLIKGTDTDVHLAVYTNDGEILECVLAAIQKRGLDALELLNHHGNTPLLAAVITSSKLSIIEKLLKAGCNVNAKSTDGCTPLMRAITTHSIKSVELLLAAGADITLADKDNWSALHYAVCYDNEEILELLLNSINQLKCDLNLKSITGDTPVALSKTPGILKRMIAAGCNIKSVKDGERSSISHAINRGDPLMVRAFMTEGASLSLTEGTWTDLHRAVTSENEIITQCVLDAILQIKGNINVKTHDGFTPLGLAKNNQVSEAVIDILIKAGCL